MKVIIKAIHEEAEEAKNRKDQMSDLAAVYACQLAAEKLLVVSAQVQTGKDINRTDPRLKEALCDLIARLQRWLAAENVSECEQAFLIQRVATCAMMSSVSDD
jgi:hypothetical protein